jgi:YggT family protein
MNPVLIDAVNAFFWVLYLMLVARVILSWFPIDRNNFLMSLLFSFTEPVLAPIRRLVHRSPLGGPGMVIDFSVLIAFILLQIIQRFVMNLLIGL